jgi:4-azaleucine resistance transporter AzlC
MKTARAAWWAGFKAEAPILLGGMPFGMIYGVLALASGLSPTLALAMSSIVFAGSAQFVVAQLLAAAVPGLAIIVTAAIVNLRHALYSASLAPFLKHLGPGWKWLLAYLLTDEAYAVAIMHYNDDTTPLTFKHWYLFGAGFALWSSWQLSTAVGVLLGSQIPASWGLDFTLALTFIALVVPALLDRAVTAAAFTGGTIAVLAYGLPYKLGLIVAAFSGIAVGMLFELKRQKPAIITTEATDELPES